MGKSYEVLKKELRQELMEQLNCSEEQVYYMENKTEASKGERLIVEVSKSGHGKAVLGIWVHEIYEEYRKTEDLDAIVEWAVREINRVKAADYTGQIADMGDYDKVKDRLFVRLLNLENNREELQHFVYRTVGDIAMALYFRLAENEKGVTSMKVAGNFLEKWNLDADDVMDAALENTARIDPPRIYRLEKMIFDLGYEGEEINEDADLDKGILGNCMSTSDKTNGAVSVFLPGVAKRLGELLDSDFYMAFTSVHEVMIHDIKSVQWKELENIVSATIQGSTPAEDYLTSRIYRYDRVKDSIYMMADGEEE